MIYMTGDITPIVLVFVM